MTFRELRLRLTPDWLGTDARRRWRNIVFRRLGIARCHLPPALVREPGLKVRSALRYVVADQLLRNREFTFLQIGAYDGVGDDDLGELIQAHRLRGVLVEPQPAAFAKLQQTYADQPQLTLLQAAIAERPGTRELYCRRDRPSMAASFDRQNLLKHGIPADQIVAVPVACHTVDTALAAAGLGRVDLIQIDAEGYDHRIIRAINFPRIRPAIVRFEYRHMGRRDADACLALLAGHGYRFLVEERDIIACRLAGAALRQPLAA
jgi:FkbM family methyltransferase